MKVNVGVVAVRCVANLVVLLGCVSAVPAVLGQVTDQSTEQGADEATDQGAESEGRVVVARVNGQPIYEDQIQPDVQKMLASFQKLGMHGNADQTTKRVRLRVLNSKIGNLLVSQASKKLTVEDMEAKIDLKVKELEQKFGAGEGMERYLKIRRITMDDLRKSLVRRVQMDEYLKKVSVLEADVPEEKVRAMYDQDPNSFSRDETAHVRHILIAVKEDASAEEKQAARQKAEQIRQEILDGKDFAELAKQHSQCVSARSGGDLGNIRRKYMPEAFEKVAFTLEKDAISEVVETKFGYHIIQQLEHTPAGVVPYEDMRAFLLKYLQDEEAKKRLEQHIVELRKKADVQVLIE